jgi:hypothetical protein
MPNASYTYEYSSFPNRTYSGPRLNSEIETSLGSSKKVITLRPTSPSARGVTVTFAAALTQEEKAKLDAVIAAHVSDANHLPTLKKRMFVFIDKKTRDLIARGFEFGGMHFSLTDNAQKTLLGLKALCDDPTMTYPVRYNALNDEDGSILLNNATDVCNIFLSGHRAFRLAWDSGTDLKERIRAATTLEELKRIIDTR